MRVFPSKLALLALVAFAAPIAGAQPANHPDSLWQQATLYRDEWGVPHVYADNLRAMAFALGYAQAEDHLEPMLLAYRAAEGRLSQLYGEAFAASDALALQLGHGDLAREVYGNADPITRELCEGFALGVNTWLLEHFDSAPPWAEGANPADVLALLHAYLMSHAPFDLPGAYRRPPGTTTANAWATAPSRSPDGTAMLVMNPHADYTDVFQWYEVHLVAPGLDVYGATLFGLPMVLQGFNQNLGWALAPNDPDFADIYTDFTPQTQRNPNSVMRQSGPSASFLMQLQALEQSKPLYVRTMEGLEEQRVPRLITPQGVLITPPTGSVQFASAQTRRRGGSYIYRIGGHGQFGALRQLYEMAAASNLADFRRALERRQLPCFHVVYADADGQLFYTYNVTMGDKTAFPRAPFTASAWDAPVAASDPAYDWGPTLPLASLPSLLNPASGYVQACGTPPWGVTDAPGFSPADWPAWLARDVDTPRAKRVRRLLGEGPRTFEEHQAMLHDTVAPFASDAVPALLDAADAHPDFVLNAHPDLPAVMDTLRQWDYRAEPDSTAMTFFHVWWSSFKVHWPQALPAGASFYDAFNPGDPGVQQHALQSAAEAARLLRNQFQTISVPWGDVHKIRRGDRVEGLGGATSGGPLFVTTDQYFNEEGWPVTGGSAFGMVVAFGDVPRAVSYVPFGASERFDSRHFDDQLELLLTRRYKVVRYLREDVERYAQGAMGRRFTLRAPQFDAAVRINAGAPVLVALEVDERLPYPAPAGTATFGPVFEPKLLAGIGPVDAEFSVVVPEAMADEARLPEIALYGHHPQHGWYRAPQQTWDVATRTLHARVGELRAYTLFGPLDARGDGAVEQQPLRNIVPKPDDYTPLMARRSDNMTPPATSRILVESTRPPITHGGADVEAAVAPTTSGAFPATTAPSGPLLMPEQSAPRFGATDVDASPGSAAVAEMVSNRPDFEPTEIAALEAPAAAAPVETSTAAPIAAEDLPDPTKSASGVIWSSVPPSALREEGHQNANRLFLAPEGAVASSLEVGTKLLLRPPVPGGVFNVTTRKPIRAQVVVSDRAPAPPPDGLVPFSYIFSIEYDPRVPGATAVSMTVPPVACAPERRSELRLFTFDEDNGWQPAQEPRVNVQTGNYTALDLALRSYAVLGPADAQLQAPPPLRTQN